MSMIHEIMALAPKYKRPLRKGRGESSGHGKTSGRGNKGSGARVGKPMNVRHEGGQTRIYRRLPTRGFSNQNFETNWYIVNLAELEDFANGATVDVNALIEANLVPDAKCGVKILGDGNLTKKLTVIAGWYSKPAHQKIIAAGGTAQNAKGQTFEFPKPKKRFIPREPVKKAKMTEEAPAAEATAAKPAEEKKPE